MVLFVPKVSIMVENETELTKERLVKAPLKRFLLVFLQDKTTYLGN